MRLFLIRHSETVDNVAGLYAGSRDSALTNHGIEQARRLGAWFSKERPHLTHIFASPLQRAHKTADAIRTAQAGHNKDTPLPSGGPYSSDGLVFVNAPELQEQDFGFYEGKPFYARQADSSKTGRESHYEAHRNDPGFVDVESKVSLCARCDVFLDTLLMPLFDIDRSSSEELRVAIVSHGILLSNLWRRILLRLPSKSITIAPEVFASRGQIILEHLGGWSNTGFLELSLQPLSPANVERLLPGPEDNAADKQQLSKIGQEKAVKESQHEETDQPASDVADAAHDADVPATQAEPVGDVSLASKPSVEIVTDKPVQSVQVQHKLELYATTILAIDSKQHLVGLKRTRGGIGRAKHDESQRSVDSFFKRVKKE